MKQLGIDNLTNFAKANVNIVQLETAMLRLGKDFVRKGREINIQMD
jgi:hypothetical protein